MIEITKDNFQKEVILSKIPVVVEFWSDYCVQCYAFTPKLQRLESKLNKIKFTSLNIKNNIQYSGSELTKQNDINSLPTCLIFKEGKVIGKIIGNLSEGDIESEIKKLLSIK